MGLISNRTRYNSDSTISREDYLIGTDSEDAKRTKTYSLGEIADFLGLGSIDNSLLEEVINNLISQNDILSGNIVYSGTGMIYQSTPYAYIIAGELYNAPPNNNISLSNGGAEPRIDVIAGDINGNIVVIQGDESANPVEPALQDYDTQIKLAIVVVSAGETQPTGFNLEQIYNEMTGEPNEWTVTENTSSERIDLSSSTDPYLGSVSISAVSPQDADQITFTNDSSVASSNYKYLVYRIKFLTPVTKDFVIKTSLLSGGVQTIDSVGVTTNNYPIDGNNVTDHQLVVIPLSDFSDTDFNFERILFTLDGQKESYRYFIDDVKLVSDPLDQEPQDLAGCCQFEEFTPDAYLGKRFRPLSDDVRGMWFDNSFNGRVGVQVVNTDGGNGATSGFVASTNAGVFTGSISLQHFGSNYFVPFMRDKGALFSADDINYIVTNNSTHDFWISPDGTSSNSVNIFTVRAEGTLTVGDEASLTKTYIVYTYATLPTPAQGMTAVITDADNVVGGGVVSGGGSGVEIIFHNGTDWIYLGGGSPSDESLLPNATIASSTNTSNSHVGGMNEVTSATDITITVQQNSTEDIPVGSVLTYNQANTGRVSVAYSGSASGDSGQTYKEGDVLTLWHKSLDNWVILNPPHALDSTIVGEPTGSDQVFNVVSLTQAEYDAGTPVATTLYNIIP